VVGVEEKEKDEYGGGHGGSGVLILKYKLNKIDSSQRI